MNLEVLLIYSTAVEKMQPDSLRDNLDFLFQQFFFFFACLFVFSHCFLLIALWYSGLVEMRKLMSIVQTHRLSV